jgi:hypothetical protein
MNPQFASFIGLPSPIRRHRAHLFPSLKLLQPMEVGEVRRQPGGRGFTPGLITLLAAAVLGVSTPTAARAAGVVSMCDQTHLQAALAGGGLVTFACSADIALSSTLSISTNTTIDATGYNVTLDGQNHYQVMSVNSGVTLSITNLTIANGYGGENFGGGIYNLGTLIVTNSTFSGNSAVYDGGGIYNNDTAIFTNSTFSGNSTGSEGAGGGILSAGSTLIVANCTFSGNSAGAEGNGGGILNASTLIVTNSTFSGNSAGSGGGIYNVFYDDLQLQSAATIKNTIIVDNGSGGACYDDGGTLTDGGYNLDDDGTCGFRSAASSFSNDKSVTFTSASPQNNGGSTATLALQYTPSNDAIGAIPPGANGCATSIAIDQRGVTRPGSVNGDCSIGAYEYVSGTSASDGVTVTTITDCTDDAQLQSAVGAGGRIVFACSGDIPLTKTLAIGGNTTMDATGQIVMLDGQNNVTVLASPYALALNNLTIANGNGSMAGGIEANPARLTITNSSIQNNTGQQSGGVYSNGLTTVANSTFLNNTSQNEGGGLSVGGNNLSVVNSTFYNNSAGTGAEISAAVDSAVLLNSSLYNVSTIATNSLLVTQTPAVLENTLIVGSGSPDCSGGFTDDGYNLADDSTCGFTASSSQTNATGLNLGPLSNNGGPTLTIPLNPGSVALGAIPLGSSGCGAVSTATSTPILTDERGVFRPQQSAQAAACDIGALQTAQDQVQVTFNSSPGAAAYDVGPGSYTGQQILTLPVGTQSTVWAPSPQTSNGTEYTYVSWSDSGAEAHPITISPALTTLTASFNTFYLLTTAVNPGGAGTVSISANAAGSNGYYPAGTGIALTANANTGYVFSNWTGTNSSSSNPLSFTLNSPVTETANFAQTVNVTVGASPSGLSFTVDGTSYTSAQTLTWTVGSQHTIATTTPQSLGNSPYQFVSWSDGGAISHTVIASTSTTNYTANFTPAATFTITPKPTSETVKSGSIGALLLTLKSVNGFSGNVKLSCSGGPAGSYCTDFPMTVHLNGTALAASGIFFPRSTKSGVYVITFTGTSGSLTNTATATFTVK